MFTNAYENKIPGKSTILFALMLLAGSMAAQNLQLTFSTQPPTCFGYTNGTATVTASGGSGQYGYAWNNGQFGQTNLGLGAGTYTVTVSDQSTGATATGEILLTQPATVQTTITSTGLSCTGMTGTLTAAGSGGTGAYAYLWSTGSTSASTAVTAAGNYFVTTTDANGCASIVSQTVIAPVTLSMNVVNIPCSYLPQGGSIGVAVSGGSAPHSYLWSNGSTNAVILNQSAGTYTVTVTDNRGCTAVATEVLSLPTPIQVQIVSITPACGGSNGSATVIASGGTPPYRYVWGNGTLGPTATNLAPGQYYVCTFDANNCQLDTWIIIPGAASLNVTLSPTGADCNAVNGSATVTVNPTAGNYTYTWNVPNTPNTATTVSGIPAGTTVLVTVTETTTGCQGTASTTINTQNNLSASITDTDIPCGGVNNGTASGTATGGTGTLTYTWTYPDNTAFTGQQISGLAPGQYSLLVSDSQGCTATASTEITVLSDVNLQVGQANVRTCLPEATLTATADANATLTWFDANGNQIGTGGSITVAAGADTALYKVVASNGSGCSAERIVTVTPNALDLSFAVNNPAQACADIPVTWTVTNNNNVPDVSYTWAAPTGVTLTPATSATPLINAPSGSYDITVTATTPQGCTATLVAPLRVADRPEISVDNNNITSCSTLVTINALVVGTSNILWFDANNNNIGSGLSITVPAGTYSVVASNGQDCSDTEILTIKTNAADINLAANNPAQACSGATLNWSVLNTDPNDQLTFQWTAPAGVVVTPSNSATPTVTSNTGGLYAVSVTATNQFGCSSTLSAPLNVTARPEISVDKKEVTACEAQTTLSATVTNAMQIVWTNAAGTPIGTGASITFPSGTAPTSYTVTASNGQDCSVTETINLTPNPVDVNFALNNQNQLCHLTSTNWSTVNNDPNDVLTYQWTTPANVTVTPPDGTNVSIAASAPGNYMLTVTATNQFGCTATLTAPLAVALQPEITVDKKEVTSCEPQTTLSATVTNATQITWTNAAGTTVGTGSSVTFPSGTTPTTYTVTASNGAGCSATETILLTPNAVDVNFSVNNQNQLCQFKTTNWSAINNDLNDQLTYVWTAPANVTATPANSADPVISATAPGNYMLTVTATNQHGCTATLTAPLNVVEKPDLKVDANSVTACLPQITLSATATGSAQINWTNAAGILVGSGASVTLPSGTVPVTYTATASNGVGCTASETVTVTPHPVDLNFDTHTQQICEGNTAAWAAINMDPNDVLTYRWYNTAGVNISPATGPNTTITALAPGAYTITVTATNQHGCTATLTDVLNVQERTSLSGKVGIDLCKGKTVAFDNTSSFPGTWIFGDGQSATGLDVSHSYANPGSYTVTFTPQDNCVKPFDTTIVVQPAPALQAAIGNNLQNCVGQAVINFIDQSQHTGTLQSWNWNFQPGNQSSNQQNPSVTFATEGSITATLIVKDNNGCVDSSTVSLRADVVNESLNPNFEFCPGGSATLNPDFKSDYTYVWTANPPDPNLNPSSGNPQVAPSVPTTYTMEVSKGTCKATFSALVKPLPALSLQAPEDQAVCHDNPVSVTAQGPSDATYTWSVSPTFSPVAATGSTLTVTPSGKTTYYVRAEKPGECPGIDSLVLSNSKVRVEAFGPAPVVCKGTDAELAIRNLNPTDELSYQWSSGLPGVPNPTVKPEVSGAYTVTVANQAGCTASLSINVAVIDVRVTADIIGKDTICFGEFAQLSATAAGATNYTYAWSPTGTLDDPTIADPKANPEITTLYTVTVTAEALCTATADVRVFFTAQQCIEPYIFVPKAFTPNGDQNNDYFRVRGNNITELYMVVWNRWGEKVFETTDLENAGWDGSFNGKESTPDSYAWLVKVKCGNGATWTKKGDVTLLK